MNSPGQQVPNMLLKISREIISERMNRRNQSKTNNQLWIWQVTEVKFDSVKSNIVSVTQFSHSVVSDSATPWTTACQATLSITNSQESTQTHVHWVGDAIQPSHPLSSPSPPALNLSQHQDLFKWVQLFTSGGQSTGVSASASVLPMNTQDWFPLGWTGWISLQSKELSRIFYNTTVQNHQFFGTQLSL